MAGGQTVSGLPLAGLLAGGVTAPRADVRKRGKSGGGQMITNGFTYAAVLLFMAGVLVTLEKNAAGWLKKLFKVIPAVVLCANVMRSLA
jgi:hypothetical protein